MKVHQVIVYAASLMLLSSAVRGDVSAEAPLVDADDLASEVANIRSTPPKDEDFMPSSGRELDTDMEIEMDSMGEEPDMTPTLPRPSRRRTSWNTGGWKKPKKQHWNKQWGWKKDPWWNKKEWGWKKDPWWNKPAWGHNDWWSKPSWKKPSWNDDYDWHKPSWGRGRKGPRKNKNLFHRRDQELNLWASPSNDETDYDYDDEGGDY